MFKSFPYLAALCVIALGGFFIHYAFKQTAKNATLKCELAHKNQAIEAAKEADKDREDIENEERQIDDIDSALASIGILRPDEDR